MNENQVVEVEIVELDQTQLEQIAGGCGTSILD